MDSATGEQAAPPLTHEERVAQAGRIQPSEKFWRDHQPWLEEKGYRLRRRYRPDWKPSWEGTSARPWEREDGLSSMVSAVQEHVP